MLLWYPYAVTYWPRKKFWVVIGFAVLGIVHPCIKDHPLLEDSSQPIMHLHHNKVIAKPWHMREGYSSCFVCVSVATNLFCMSKVRRYTVSCMLLKICIVWTSLKMFYSRDIVSFASHNDWWLSFSWQKTHQSFLTWLQINGIVYELLAKSDD